jgi:hypothetical protein
VRLVNAAPVELRHMILHRCRSRRGEDGVDLPDGGERLSSGYTTVGQRLGCRPCVTAGFRVMPRAGGGIYGMTPGEVRPAIPASRRSRIPRAAWSPRSRSRRWSSPDSVMAVSSRAPHVSLPPIWAWQASRQFRVTRSRDLPRIPVPSLSSRSRASRRSGLSSAIRHGRSDPAARRRVRRRAASWSTASAIKALVRVE